MRRFITAAVMFLFVATPAFAHFQMIYTPEMAYEKGGKLDFQIVFTHPFSAGHTMNMGTPIEFFMMYEAQGKVKKEDLTGKLEKVSWTSLTNSGDAYMVKGIKARKMGDYIFGLIPAPYYEGEEDIYIQQLTKVVINNAGEPTIWADPAGMPAEIMPLDKPYALWTGNLFRGVVMAGGKPVPGAEIEVEFVNHPPVPGKNAFQEKAIAKAPQAAFETMGILADQNGQFAYAIPKAGWWGFCALGVGPQKTHEGKELSQDAVIWVQAKDMK
ncbi:MAG: nickel transporter [Desulfobacterales bacterium]|nr:MAG: nickel transporter [Desulfobacterales bacterium]